jgi:uncharacterized membrane protein
LDITPTSQSIARNNAQAQHEHKNLLEGIHFKFPTFKHDHPPVIDVNEVADEQLTAGQRIADGVAATMGSWRFIIIQSCILAAWLILNSVAWINHWDSYPFILLNLALSFEAAYAAPIIMMSQNRQATKDRIMAESDYHTNTKGEEETRNIMEHLDHQDTVMLQIIQRLEAQEENILRRLAQIDPEMAQRLIGDIRQISEELSDSGEGGVSMSGNS